MMRIVISLSSMMIASVTYQDGVSWRPRDDMFRGPLQMRSLLGSPFLGVPELGITGGVANQDHVVDAAHIARS
jgi:hypothetical protein